MSCLLTGRVNGELLKVMFLQTSNRKYLSVSKSNAKNDRCNNQNAITKLSESSHEHSFAFGSHLAQSVHGLLKK